MMFFMLYNVYKKGRFRSDSGNYSAEADLALATSQMDQCMAKTGLSELKQAGNYRSITVAVAILFLMLGLITYKDFTQDALVRQLWERQNNVTDRDSGSVDTLGGGALEMIQDDDDKPAKGRGTPLKKRDMRQHGGIEGMKDDDTIYTVSHTTNENDMPTFREEAHTFNEISEVGTDVEEMVAELEKGNSFEGNEGPGTGTPAVPFPSTAQPSQWLSGTNPEAPRGVGVPFGRALQATDYKALRAAAGKAASSYHDGEGARGGGSPQRSRREAPSADPDPEPAEPPPEDAADYDRARKQRFKQMVESGELVKYSDLRDSWPAVAGGAGGSSGGGEGAGAVVRAEEAAGAPPAGGRAGAGSDGWGQPPQAPMPPRAPRPPQQPAAGAAAQPSPRETVLQWEQDRQAGHTRVLPPDAQRQVTLPSPLLSDADIPTQYLPSGGGPPTEAPATRADVIVVAPTATHRHGLVHTTRATWRRGLRTLVASNGTAMQALAIHGPELALEANPLLKLFDAPPHPNPTELQLMLEEQQTEAQEVWVTYEDIGKDMMRHAYTPGDKRMLAAVRLANETFWDEGYKWMIFGDDDMFVFVDTLLEMLEPYDPSVPYMISDDVHNCCHHNCREPPYACLPPHMAPEVGVIELPAEAGGSGNRSIPCIWQPAVAPCSNAVLADTALCSIKTIKGFFNGGRGVIISRGMMQAISVDHWKACEGYERGGGDHRVSLCVWRAGYSITTPTAYSQQGQCRFGRDRFEIVEEELTNALNHGCCRNDICMHWLYQGVTVPFDVHHSEAASSTLELMQHLHELYTQVKLLQPAPCSQKYKDYHAPSVKLRS